MIAGEDVMENDVINKNHNEENEHNEITKDEIPKLLETIFHEKGLELLNKVEEIDSLMNELFGHLRLERRVLILTLREKIPHQILSYRSSKISYKDIQKWVIHMESEWGLHRDIATWAILVWCETLHVHYEHLSNKYKHTSIQCEHMKDSCDKMIMDTQLHHKREDIPHWVVLLRSYVSIIKSRVRPTIHYLKMKCKNYPFLKKLYEYVLIAREWLIFIFAEEKQDTLHQTHAQTLRRQSGKADPTIIIRSEHVKDEAQKLLASVQMYIKEIIDLDRNWAVFKMLKSVIRCKEWETIEKLIQLYDPSAPDYLEVYDLSHLFYVHELSMQGLFTRAMQKVQFIQDLRFRVLSFFLIAHYADEWNDIKIVHRAIRQGVDALGKLSQKICITCEREDHLDRYVESEQYHLISYNSRKYEGIEMCLPFIQKVLLYLEQKKLWDIFDTFVDKIVMEHEYQARAYFRAGKKFLEMNEIDHARSYFAKAYGKASLENHPSQDVLFDLSKMYLYLGEFTISIEVLKTFFSFDIPHSSAEKKLKELFEEEMTIIFQSEHDENVSSKLTTFESPFFDFVREMVHTGHEHNIPIFIKNMKEYFLFRTEPVKSIPALIILAHLALSYGLSEEAIRMEQEAIDLMSKISPWAFSHVLNRIMNFYKRIEKLPDSSTVKKIYNMILNVNDEYRFDCLTSIAPCLIHEIEHDFQLFQNACDIIELSADEFKKEQFYLELLASALKQDKIELIPLLTEKTSSFSDNAKKTLSSGYLEKKDWRTSLNYARDIIDPTIRAPVLLQIAYAMLEHDNKMEAYQILKESFQIANNIPDDYNRFDFLRRASDIVPHFADNIEEILEMCYAIIHNMSHRLHIVRALSVLSIYYKYTPKKKTRQAFLQFVLDCLKKLSKHQDSSTLLYSGDMFEIELLSLYGSYFMADATEEQWKIFLEFIDMIEDKIERFSLLYKIVEASIQQCSDKNN